MLTLHFEIHQDGEDAEVQARGVVAALVSIYGPSVLPGTMTRYALPKTDETVWSAPAPDGYPVDASPAVQIGASEMGGPSQVIETPSTQERDVAGIPWDERIHASTKTTNKDGTWTRRRNTPDATFDAVMAELKARNTAMTMAAAGGLIDKVGTLEMGIPAPEPTAAEAFTPPPSVVIAPTVPQPPVVPTPPVPAPVPVADDAAAEPVAIMRVLNDKRVAGDTLAAVLAKAGLPGLAGVFTAPIEARRIIAAELAVL